MPIDDFFGGEATRLDDPPANAFAITPNDSTDLDRATRAICVGASGNVQLTTVSGDTVTINVAAGMPFPIRAARIWATNTTATGIVGLY